MKCPKCRTTMIKKNKNNNYWWQCPACKKEVGKKNES